MNIPKKIKIIGTNIDINYNNKEAINEGVYGKACYNDLKIILRKDIPEDLLNVTFIHELLHFIFFILNYRNLMNDEEKISQLSEILYQVIQQLENKR